MDAPTPQSAIPQPAAPQTAAPQPASPAAQAPEQPAPNRVLLSWQAPEFVYYEKDTKWFVYGGLVLLFLIAAAAVLQQWLMIVVILALAAVIVQHARREPRTLEYKITEHGVETGEKFHPYNELKSFWIIYNPPVKTLYIESTKRLIPQIQVQLADQDPTQIRQALHSRIPEQEKRTEDWLDSFGRLIRF
jgi:hypothetical protein